MDEDVITAIWTRLQRKFRIYLFGKVFTTTKTISHILKIIQFLAENLFLKNNLLKQI